MTVNTIVCQKCNKIIEYSPSLTDRMETCPRCRSNVLLTGSDAVFDQSKSNISVFVSALGNKYVRYQCLGCGEGLRSPLEEAGSAKKCPYCRVEFVVPGATELNRTSSVAAQQLHRETELEILTTQLENTCRLEKARAEVMTEQKVKQLEAIYVQAMSDLGLRKKNSKEMALLRFTDLIAENIKKIDNQNWPAFLVSETIAEMLEVRNRVVESIIQGRNRIEDSTTE